MTRTPDEILAVLDQAQKDLDLVALEVSLPEYHAIANTASIDSSPVRAFLDIQEIALDVAATDLLDQAQTIQDSAADGTGSPAEPDRPGRPWRDILTELL
jgi:hypothetical protein